MHIHKQHRLFYKIQNGFHFLSLTFFPTVFYKVLFLYKGNKKKYKFT